MLVRAHFRYQEDFQEASMKLHVVIVLILLYPLTLLVVKTQVRAGTPEYRLFEQISAEMNPDTKIELITSFEKEFPQSKILARVYLMAVDVYRARQDRAKINEYGEKALQLDGSNITALMMLARNYAIEAKNLDRAVDLAQRAVDRMEVLRQEPLPSGYSPTQWKDYLRTNSDSAEQILQYVSAVRARAESVKSSKANPPAGEPTKAPNANLAQDQQR
jgi:hypothetical protein